MTIKTIHIPLEELPANEVQPVQTRVQECLSLNAEACAEAASIWARLHYGHAAYVDGTLNAESLEFSSENTGKVKMAFDWTFQDGCSDTFKEGIGYVEVEFAVSENQLILTWAWPDQASTVDEF